MSDDSTDAARGTAADRVVLSFRDAAVGPGESDGWTDAREEWVCDELESDTYGRYLRRVRAGPVSEGEAWDEFVSCGCASPRDVTLRVERVEGGPELTADTELSFVASEARASERVD